MGRRRRPIRHWGSDPGDRTSVTAGSDLRRDGGDPVSGTSRLRGAGPSRITTCGRGGPSPSCTSTPPSATSTPTAPSSTCPTSPVSASPSCGRPPVTVRRERGSGGFARGEWWTGLQPRRHDAIRPRVTRGLWSGNLKVQALPPTQYIPMCRSLVSWV